MSNALILVGGSIFDEHQGAFVEGGYLVVEDDRIKEVKLGGDGVVSAETDAQLVDVGGAFILPGLIDCHWHLLSRTTWAVTDEMIATGTIEGVLNAAEVVAAGVTTVRDPGCRHRGIYALKRAIESGLIQGPRAFVAGPNPTGTGAPPEYRNVYGTGADELRRIVREEWRAGADWIKLFISEATPESGWKTIVRYLNDDELAAAVDEAHAKGVRTGCHLEGLPAAWGALNAGMDVFDHGTVLDREIASQMAEQGTFYVPTLWAFTTETQLGWGSIPPEKADVYREAFEDVHRRSFEAAAEAGVVIGAGSDSIDFIPVEDALVRELEVLVAYGMAKIDALRAATVNAARVLGDEQRIGSLEAGKLADVVVVADNPLDDLRALVRTLLVMKGGELLLNDCDQRERAEARWDAISADETHGERINMTAAKARG